MLISDKLTNVMQLKKLSQWFQWTVWNILGLQTRSCPICQNDDKIWQCMKLSWVLFLDIEIIYIYIDRYEWTLIIVTRHKPNRL